MSKKYFLTPENSDDIKEVEIITSNDFLDDLYNKTFFDTRIIDELEDYLFQNKITIVKIK